jgi:hypothetical protein
METSGGVQLAILVSNLSPALESLGFETRGDGIEPEAYLIIYI